jgi:hypothetical protein
MNGRSTENQQTHDNLVRALAKHYSSLGYIGIRADIPEYTQTPSGIYWNSAPDKKYIPDIVCFMNDANKTMIIAEAETCDSLDTMHTLDQWKLFSANAKQRNGEFHVITPQLCKDKAHQSASTNGITVNKFWWI